MIDQGPFLVTAARRKVARVEGREKRKERDNKENW